MGAGLYGFSGSGFWYDILDWPCEFFRYRRIRPSLWEGLRGKILDLGAGTGRNVPYYPQDAWVAAVDQNPSMLSRAERRMGRCGKKGECVVSDAKNLRFPDHFFDACVSTFLFCVLPDNEQPAVLGEVRRVLKPGGRLFLLEYVYSRHPARRFWMRTLAPFVEWVYGARFDRRTKNHLTKGGWRVMREEFAHADTLLFLEAV